MRVWKKEMSFRILFLNYLYQWLLPPYNLHHHHRHDHHIHLHHLDDHVHLHHLDSHCALPWPLWQDICDQLCSESSGPGCSPSQGYIQRKPGNYHDWLVQAGNNTVSHTHNTHSTSGHRTGVRALLLSLLLLLVLKVTVLVCVRSNPPSTFSCWSVSVVPSHEKEQYWVVQATCFLWRGSAVTIVKKLFVILMKVTLTSDKRQHFLQLHIYHWDQF